MPKAVYDLDSCLKTHKDPESQSSVRIIYLRKAPTRDLDFSVRQMAVLASGGITLPTVRSWASGEMCVGTKDTTIYHRHQRDALQRFRVASAGAGSGRRREKRARGRLRAAGRSSAPHRGFPLPDKPAGLSNFPGEKRVPHR